MMGKILKGPELGTARKIHKAQIDPVLLATIAPGSTLSALPKQCQAASLRCKQLNN